MRNSREVCRDKLIKMNFEWKKNWLKWYDAESKAGARKKKQAKHRMIEKNPRVVRGIMHSSRLNYTTEQPTNQNVKFSLINEVKRRHKWRIVCIHFMACDCMNKRILLFLYRRSSLFVQRAYKIKSADDDFVYSRSEL